MRGLILVAILAFLGMGSGPVFASECETRLVTSMAIVAERALGQGKLSLEQLKATVESDVPVNPLAHVTPGSRTAALKAFFQDQIARVQDWSVVRAELRSLVELRAGLEQVRGEAARATELVFDPQEIVPPSNREFRGVLITSKGQIYRPVIESGRLKVLEFSSGREVAPEQQANGFVQIEEGANGDLMAVFFNEENQGSTWWNLKWHVGKSRYVRRVLNLKTGVSSEAEVFATKGYVKLVRSPGTLDLVYTDGILNAALKDKPLKLNLSRLHQVLETSDGEKILLREPFWNPTLSYNILGFDGVERSPYAVGNFIESQGTVAAGKLKDGRLAMVNWGPVRGDDRRQLRYLAPSYGRGVSPVTLNPQGRVTAVKVFVTPDEHVLVGAREMTEHGYKLEIFDPERSLDPISSVTVAEFSRFAMGSFKGKVILALTDGEKELSFYEPLASDTKILSLTAPGEVDGLRFAGDQRTHSYLIYSDDNSQHVLDLFGRSRRSR